MASWGNYILSRLFIAAPELQIDEALLTLLRREGLVSDADLSTAANVRQKAKKYSGIASSMRGKSLVERLLLVAPEIMSAATIDALRRWDLIGPTLGNALRVGLRGGKAALPGKVDEATALERLAALGKSALSFDTINLLRDLDSARIKQLASTLPDLPENRAAMQELLRISILRGNQLRSVLSTGRLSADTLAAAQKANGIWGILTVVGEGLLSDRLLRDAVRVGAISPESFNLVSAMMKIGLNVWKKGMAAIEADSHTARMLLMSEGILSPEMITALRQAGLISPELARMLFPAARGIRAITRGQLQKHMKGVRIRVTPGESPLRTYARITGRTDKEILKLLAEAARDSRNEAERLMRTPQFGRLTRAAQQRLIENTLHQEMRRLWEGVGHLTIFGEKEAARAALASADFLEDKLWANTGKLGADYRRTIRREAESAIDAFIGRQENLHNFSKRIYKNDLLARDLIGRRVNIGLLRGLSAKELAATVEGLIRPGAPGGVSYNAMRLARTEINNAFHFSQIRHTREMPWVDGYRWNLSGSHPKVDVCSTMAQGNHSNLGRGIYSKADVPGKPHPNCLCYLTTITASNAKFERQLRAGTYAPYLSAQNKDGAFPEISNYKQIYASQAQEVARMSATAWGVRALKSLAPLAVSLAIQGLFV